MFIRKRLIVSLSSRKGSSTILSSSKLLLTTTLILMATTPLLELLTRSRFHIMGTCLSTIIITLSGSTLELKSLPSSVS
jgi:hypothetical protein